MSERKCFCKIYFGIWSHVRKKHAKTENQKFPIILLGMEAQEACTRVMRHPDYVASILRAFQATQLHIDGVLCHCARVCKTWHAAVGQMQHDRVWFLSYVRNAELWVAQAPLRVQAVHAMHASCLEAYAKEVFTASGFGSTART